MLTCSYCKRPIEDRILYITILDQLMNIQKPMLEVHNSCAYDVRHALDVIIKEVEDKIEDQDESN